MSAMGITQIAAVMGSCVAGGAYLPIMSDETLMVEGNGSIFLAGPYLVKAAIGENIDVETLGGAVTHNTISGIADYKFDTEKDCLDQVKKLDAASDVPAAYPYWHQRQYSILNAAPRLYSTFAPK